jgi:hypothetical protein
LCLLSVAATGLLCLLPGAAEGQELIAGWEGASGRGYAFLSPVLGVQLSQRHALVIRGAASYLYYEFPEAAGITDVTSPGAAAGLAYRLRGRRATATIGPGFELRRTTRQPSAGTRSRATERGLTAQGDIFFQPTPLTTLSLIASYGHANRYIWTRLGLKRQVTNPRFTEPAALGLGLEVTGQGNRDVRSYQAGAVFALDLVRASASLQLRGGYARLSYADASKESRAYFGAGFYQAL